jgi:hypothetical protein
MKGKPLPLPSRSDRLSLIDEKRKDNQDAPLKSDYSSDRHRSCSTTSKSIPIKHDHLKGQEDWDFQMQEMLANERDHRMFVRIVTGMIARQGSEHFSDSCQSETDKIIARIMQTRYKKLDSESSNSTDDSESFSYDDQTKLTLNGHQDHLGSQNNEEDDGLPDGVFIIDM